MKTSDMLCFFPFKIFLQVIYTPLMHYKHWNLFFGNVKKIQNLGLDPLVDGAIFSLDLDPMFVEWETTRNKVYGIVGW